MMKRTVTNTLFCLALLIRFHLLRAGVVIEQGASAGIIRELVDDPQDSSIVIDEPYDNTQTESKGAAETEAKLLSPASYEYGTDLGVSQIIDINSSEEIAKLMEEARSYVKEFKGKERYSRIHDLCTNTNENCAFWSVLGECQNNPGYMHVNCAPVCKSCEMLDIETRCPIDPNGQDVLQPGDVDALFENIVQNEAFAEFGPVVLSRPSLAPGDTIENATYTIDGPWLIMFDNFANEQETNRLIELGGKEGYERSSDVGKQKADGTFENNVNAGRTSTNAWCKGDCSEDSLAKSVMERMAMVTGVPSDNSEYLQLLRYENGQFYQSHNDYIPHQVNRPCGVRILTFYLYLSDVEEGGGTNFPNLNMTVTPKRGRAVLWPSVRNDSPNSRDYRTDHQALPVIQGVKYGANAWFHQRDYREPHSRGCN